MDFNFIEFLGYMATFFVAASFLFKSIVHLRIVNSIGAILFVIYSLIITAYPVAVLNAFLVVVNIYQLWRLKQENLSK
ncbi:MULTISPECIES: YgjV family protein [Haemophilus]|uniref:YgjV family protein n=1 Tax=Haemophilus TaxID=724 RepID=UPI0001A66058|nr:MULTISPECIES: YgjV family protein [Haemophilus]KMZ22921.1 membrane protein [Haemophilus influenzae]MBK1414698.1 YgjV family protein [Haemophilus influenzae]MCK8808511.1 YgjV family protein [Haemophilus influenzae]MCK8883283.1 YgjV family protein [Haemophilus influenzae]MCK8898174.1 YgjV family protein [Haemophilus influenzae]